MQLQQVTENYPPLPPPLSPTFTRSISCTQRELQSVTFINPKSHAYVSAHQKHRFNSDGACSAPPSLNHRADPVATKPNGTRLYHHFKSVDSYTLSQPHECSSDHAAPLPEMRSQRLTGSTIQRTTQPRKSPRYAIQYSQITTHRLREERA